MNLARYAHCLEELKDKKSGIVWNVMMLGMFLDDSDQTNASKIVLEITRDMTDVTELIEVYVDLTHIPEIITEVKIIKDVTSEFATLVRETSWHSTCEAFDPGKSLGTARLLIRTLKCRPKRGRQRPESKRKVATERPEYPDTHAGDEERMARLRAIRDKSNKRQLANNFGLTSKEMNFKNILSYK